MAIVVDSEDGTRRRDWEMDLILGKGQKSAVLTMTHRSDNFIVMMKITDKKPEVVDNYKHRR